MAKQEVLAQEPKLVMKGSRQIRHDLFKLLPAKMTKNNGWKHRHPILVEHEHTHVFHSRSEKTGKANKHCSPCGNHFHEVKVDWSRTVKKTVVVDGEPQEIEMPVVTVGPALTIERVMSDDGTEIKTIVHPRIDVDGRLPQWAQHPRVRNRGQKDAYIEDDHSHDVLYIESEFFTQGERNEFRKQQYGAVRAAMEGPVSPQIAHAAALEASAARGKQIADGKGDPGAGQQQGQQQGEQK